MGNYIDKITKIAESLDWNVTVDDNYITFQRYSGYDQDFNMTIEKADDIDGIASNLYEYYDNFDCSEEASLWLDETGHGKNGAPYRMIDVYNDMEECWREIYNLYDEIESAAKGKRYIFLEEHTDITSGETPNDVVCPEDACTAIEYLLPDNFSEKAKKHFNEYYSGSAYIFEYKGKLVVTDEGLDLTEGGDGFEVPYCAPRWVCDSWKEVEAALEQSYDDLLESGLL